METTNNTPQEENAVRAVLRNEITWIFFIICSIWGAVVWIILPIQALQIKQDQLTESISEIQTGQADIPQIMQDHAVMKQEITEIQSELQAHIAQTK